jgi:hypothetical protein
MEETYRLVLLIEACRSMGQVEEGLTIVSEALDLISKTEWRVFEAEIYRLKGELTLQKEFHVQGSKFQVLDPRPPALDAQGEAEACFLKAIEIARGQQAKSWELRATMSLARLRQRQAAEYATRNTQHEARPKLDAARTMLADVYNWFTEGFDTKDLQEAKALLEELNRDASLS